MATATVQLAEQGRRRQLQLRAVTLRQLLALWPIWKLDDPDSFATFVAAAVPLLRERHRDSADLAAQIYQAMRLSAGVPGRPPERRAEFEEARAVTSLYVTGKVLTDKALGAGTPLDAAKNAALVRVTGAAARLVLDGGRETTRILGRDDPRQRGWRRHTGGRPCDWCSGQAAAAEAGDEMAAFGGHDHCACTPGPTFA